MGNHAYITANENGMDVYLNPDHDKLTELRTQPRSEQSQHSTNAYSNAVDNLNNNGTEEIMSTQPVQTNTTTLSI